MAKYSSTIKVGVIGVLLMAVLIFQCQFGKADGVRGNGSSANDPAQIVAKAMQCFNNKTVYRSCDEELRLDESGSLRAEQAEAYCRGACFTETNLVLNCLEGIMNNFRFYNNATINDVKDIFKAACASIVSASAADHNAPSGSTGNVEVGPKHLQASETSDVKVASWSLYVITYVMASQAFLRW